MRERFMVVTEKGKYSSPEIMDISSPLTIISGTSYYTPEL